MRGLSLIATLTALLLPACVLDRTGASATSGLEREMALRDAHVAELEQTADDSARRIQQLEDVIRYRGQQESAKLENLDQVRAMVGGLSGEVEVLSHELESSSETSGAFREDSDFRLTWMELRVAALEDSLALKPPPPPERADGDAEEGAEEGDDASAGADSGAVEGDEQATTAEDAEIPEDAEGLLALANAHLTAGRPKAARAVLERFVAEYGDDALADEATYRLAESYFNDGEYQQAILRFQDVVDTFGGTGWAAWSMVRQGECFEALGKADEAELFWEDVMSRYPRSKAAEEAKQLLDR